MITIYGGIAHTNIKFKDGLEQRDKFSLRQIVYPGTKNGSDLGLRMA